MVKVAHQFIPQQRYYPIPLEILTLDEILDRDLYIEMGKAFVLYRAAQHPFREDDRQRLLHSKVNSLFIACDNDEELQKFYQERLQNIVSSPLIPAKEKAEILSSCALRVAKDSFNGLPIKERIPQAEKLIESTVAYVSQDLENLAHLIGETRDHPYLFSHSINVMTFSVALLAALKVRDQRIIHETGMGAFFHDIGKSKIDRNLLDKPAPLTTDEWTLMRKHPQSGFEIMAQSPSPERSRSIVIQHHERLDGKGYPRGLSAEGLSLPSRIVSLCDAYDAMTSNRVYQKAMKPLDAFQSLIIDHSTSFDRKLVITFIELLNLKNR